MGSHTCSPGHAHDHRHGGSVHSQAPASFGPRFAAGTVLNLALVAAQVGFGLHAHSIALIADAAHNLGDAMALVLAWAGYAMARWQPTERYTYGFRSVSVLAPLISSAMLLVTTGAIIWEAIRRLADPEPVAGGTVMVVAAVAVVLNGLAAWLLMAGRQHDLNIRAAFLHMVVDAALSLGVVVAGAIVLATGWVWVDPLVSLAISAAVVLGTWRLLRDAVRLSLQGVPPHLDPRQVRDYLASRPGVMAVHDLHIWAMSTTETALTCHLVIAGAGAQDGFLLAICHELRDRFGIAHPTVQIETSAEAALCQLAPDHVV